MNIKEHPMRRIFKLFILLCLSLQITPARLQAATLQQLLLSSQKVETVPLADQRITAETDGSRIRKLLQEARAEFDKIDQPGALSFGAPPGTERYDLVRRRFLLRVIAANYDRLLSELNRSEILRRTEAAPDPNTLAGITGKDKPPYSLLLIERIQEKIQGSQFKVKLAEMAVESAAAKMSTTRDNLKKLEGQSRSLLESIEKESDPPKVAALEWNKQLLDLRRKVYATELAILQATRKNSEEELAIARKELASLSDKLDEVSRNSRFSESDLNDIKKGLEDRKYGYERDLENALAENESLQKRAEQRLAGLTTQKGSRNPVPADNRQHVAARNERTKNLLLQESLENSNLKVELLRDMLELNRLELIIWELRYAAEATGDKESASRINQMVPKALASFSKQEESNALNLNILMQKLNGLESEKAQLGSAENQDDIKRLIALYNSREELLLSRIRVTTAAKSTFLRLSDHYSEGTKNAVTKARVGMWTTALKGIWEYELFVTEDVYTVDGKEIKGQRGVTIGKVVSALALMILGLIASGVVTKILVNRAVKRYSINEGGALLARRWLLALIFVVLLFSSLNLVRIPLTAFAFLGGAIAIGTGFGIQDLMKNLMSGLMMLAERPFRIGDLIDVNGVSGRVTSIGIRSSTIRDVTGIETLVPNTTFVEKNVTNWTYSTQQVRYSITVGIAYGSNIALVKELLLSAATLHTDVLKSPEPLVTLDDFGPDSLLFGLYYWLGLDSAANPHVIASDLRVMIEKHLTGAGIALAFPQRDIHFDTLRPIPIEIVDGQLPKELTATG
jgi:potassium-dependent mechanosensitive channel